MQLSKASTHKVFFGVPCAVIHLQIGQVWFVYEGHPVKAKVTGVKYIHLYSPSNGSIEEKIHTYKNIQ